MGKGDRKSKKGKIRLGTFGKKRLARKSSTATATAAPVKAKKATKKAKI